MRVPDELLSCAIFLGRDEGTHVRYGGTGFVVALESDAQPSRVACYLATAAHTARVLEGAPFKVRVNLTGDGYAEFEVGGGQWYYHADSRVDAALCPFRFNPQVVDVIPLVIGFSDSSGTARIQAHALTLTAPLMEQLNIGVGDDVAVVGLFTRHAGLRRNTPLIRTGTLAMLPDGPIHTRGGDWWAYLIEARSIGGLSGSPAFVSQTIWTEPVVPTGGTPDGNGVAARMAGPFYWLGLVHGHWDVDPRDLNEQFPRALPDRDGGVNQGIAIVVPAEKVVEILHHPDLASMRKAIEDQGVGNMRK